MQRRDFLNITGHIMAGSMFFGFDDIYANVQKANPNDHIIIIGGGLSGLSAAYELHKKGIKFTIVEARNRIGGRVFTHPLSGSGLITELGAEWIGSSHLKIQNLCKELNIDLIDHRFSTGLITGDKFYNPKDFPVDLSWDLKYNSLLNEFKKLSINQKKKFDKIDWWRYLQSNDIPPLQLDLHELADSTDFGESIRQVSAALALAEYSNSNENNEMDFKVKSGNAKIALTLSEKIGPEKILLNKKVLKIFQKQNTVEVTCDDGSLIPGNKVICCIPIWSVLNIEWQPALPSIQLDAIRQLEYCRIIKSSVIFKERFWKNESISFLTEALPNYIFHSTQNQTGNKGALTSYTIGDKAYIFSKMTEKQKIKEICEVLKPAFGEIEKYVDDLKVTSYYWGNDIYSQGAYAVFRPGQWFELRNEIGKPFNNVIFAGEHLAQWQGFMEGAVQTGQDAVKAFVG